MGLRQWVGNVPGRQIINMKAPGGSEEVGKALQIPERGAEWLEP